MRLDPSDWSSFKANATANSLTPSAALLSLFAMILELWDSDDEGNAFCVNVPVSSRVPIDGDIDKLIGDFTTTILITVFAQTQANFVDRATTIAHQLMQRIEHRHVSGIGG